METRRLRWKSLLEDMSKKLFIEGTPDDSNGNLRIGFNKLLSKKLSGRMPSIILGEGKNKCIDKFKACLRSEPIAYLLIDLDKSSEQRDEELDSLKIADQQESVFFMIQEMEAWFLSQPNILHHYYGSDLSDKIKTNAASISNPCEKLMDIVKQTRKKNYHKVNRVVATG